METHVNESDIAYRNLFKKDLIVWKLLSPNIQMLI